MTRREITEREIAPPEIGAGLAPRVAAPEIAADEIAADEIAAELSVLVDIGSAWIKASAVGRVGGRWRVVGHTAQPSAWGEAEAKRDIAARLAGSADRRLVDRLERLLLAAPTIECHTPRRPGQLALAAVARTVSAAAARRAAESAGWVVTEEATMDDGRSLAERLAALQAAPVDAWLLTGGFDDAPSDLPLEMAGLTAAARGDRGAPVIWAGSEHAFPAVARLFEEGAVTLVASPHPRPDAEQPAPLRNHLEALLQRGVEPGGAIHLAPISLRRSVAEVARALGRRVLGVDIGAQYATWVVADESGGAESRVYASGGLASAVLVEPGGAARIARHLPQAIDDLAVADALQNLRARPATLPQTDDELAIVQAAAQIALAEVAGGVEPSNADLIIGCGRTIAAAPHPAQAAQLLLDGIRPLGVVQLAIDPAGALGPLGSLDDEEIGEGIGALRDDLLVPLGTAVVCGGVRHGQVAMRVTIHRAGWPQHGPIEVRGGQLQVVRLPRGQAAELEIELVGDATLGTPRRHRRARSEVTGGAVGLILDARGVPLELPQRPDDRRVLLSAWRDALTREVPGSAGRQPWRAET